MKFTKTTIVTILSFALILGLVSVHCERPDHRCGRSVGNPPCASGRCCSTSGWCGGSASYCKGGNCAYQCWAASAKSNKINYKNYPISEVISETLYDEMFKHMMIGDCPSNGFYAYEAFVLAALSFPGFGATGDSTTRRREVAAFLGQISQVTSGEWSDSADSHTWGLCHINTTNVESVDEKDYCTSPNWPCSSGKKYSSRGPVQLTLNYNYGLAGEALGVDLINDPDLVATDAIVSFKTAIWFWMTQHDNKPSCHDIVINANSEASQVIPSYGVIIGNIIKSGLNARVTTTSIEYYKRYCDMLGVTYGDNLNRWYDDVSVPFSEDALIKMPSL